MKKNGETQVSTVCQHRKQGKSILIRKSSRKSEVIYIEMTLNGIVQMAGINRRKK